VSDSPAKNIGARRTSGEYVGVNNVVAVFAGKLTPAIIKSTPIGAGKYRDRTIRCSGEKCFHVRGAAQQNGRRQIEDLGDRVQRGGDEPEERRGEREQLAHGPEQYIEEQREPHVAECFDEIRRESGALERHPGHDVVCRDRGVCREKASRNVPFAEEPEDHRQHHQIGRTPSYRSWSGVNSAVSMVTSALVGLVTAYGRRVP
jgi:hypothetical protein